MISNEWIKEQEIAKWVRRFQQASNAPQKWKQIYESYLHSKIWKEKRSQILKRANGRCEKCGAISLKLEVHHLTYERIGGKEKSTDLVALCHSCHLEADHQRAISTSQRQKSNRYWRRIHGFARRKYGDTWWDDHDDEDVEKEFLLYLYREYLEEQGLPFDTLDIDEIDEDLDFLEFQELVYQGKW